jgi:predicted aconitase with swiveling domain
LQTVASAFVEDEFVEDGKNLFAVVVELAEVVAEVAFVLAARLPLFEQRYGNIDIAAEGVDRVATKEEAIKEGRFPAGG